jgi:hypothetical protein
MSVRPEEQALKEPIDQILEGIDAFSKAVDERIKTDRDWKPAHLYEIMRIRNKLYELQLPLRKVKRETW